MAIERKADTSTKVAVTAAPKPKAPTAKTAPKKPAAKKSAPAAIDTVARLRADLSAARRDLALQKLDSPAKIRTLRRDLARALTAERTKTLTKETA